LFVDEIELHQLFLRRSLTDRVLMELIRMALFNPTSIGSANLVVRSTEVDSQKLTGSLSGVHAIDLLPARNIGQLQNIL
jgi:hypothetical protein